MMMMIVWKFSIEDYNKIGSKHEMKY